MAKSKGPAASEQVAWVKHLPNEGAEWGHGITVSVEAFERQAAELEAELAQKQAEHDAAVAGLKTKFDEQKARLDQSIKARKKLARDAVKRAESEASTLYANTQVDKARARAAREAQEATVAAAVVDEGEERVEGSSGT